MKIVISNLVSFLLRNTFFHNESNIYLKNKFRGFYNVVSTMDNYSDMPYKTDESLFVYGTLLIPDLLHALFGKKIYSIPAVLENHSVYTSLNKGVESDYPFLVQENLCKTKGKVLYGLNKADWELLSFYESDEYELKEVNVKIPSGLISVKTYYPKNELSIIKGNTWNIDRFIEECLPKYLSDVIPETINEFRNRF